MKIISSKRIKFLVHNIFEKYYEPIQKELDCSGLVEEFAYKLKQEILATIYRKAMDAGIETEEELDAMAVAIINERLERILVPYYAQKYVEKFSLDKVILENGMLTGIQENNHDENREQQTEQPEFREEIKENIPEPESKEVISEPELKEEPVSKEEYQEAFEVETKETEPVKEEAAGEEQENIEILDFFNEPQKPTVVRRVEEPKIRRFRINWFVTVLLSLLTIVVLWVVIGMLMGRGYIPRLDIGYSWFNKYIWSIF